MINLPIIKHVPAGETSSVSHLTAVRRDAVTILTLDRPQALNALSVGMTAAIARAISDIARDIDNYAVVIRSASDRAFCAGGDVREIARLGRDRPASACDALSAEYQLIWLLECFSKPVVSLANGIVVGAGAGITLVNTHRVAGERYAFAMPETTIGFFPDDGVAFTLARLPDEIGVYLGLTGRRIGRADAFRLGLVTHCIPSDRFDDVVAALGRADPVDPVLDGLHQEPGAAPIERERHLIARYFSGRTMSDIVARLEAASHAETSVESREWVVAVLADLARASPQALHVTLRHIRDAAALDLRQTLAVDYRLACHLLSAADFHEGVRAQLVDKDRRPRWQPADVHQVTTAMVDRIFAARPGMELLLPTRQEMQAARV